MYRTKNTTDVSILIFGLLGLVLWITGLPAWLAFATFWLCYVLYELEKQERVNNDRTNHYR